MKAILYTILNVILATSILSRADAVRGFIRNVQVADGSAVDFPGFSTASRESVTEIPIELLLRMSEVDNTRDFIKNFVYADDESMTLSNISTLFSHDVIERSASKSSVRMATCRPELKTVSVQPYEKSHLFYHPSCVRVERCGGCCAHNLLTCTPVESEILNVEVFVGEYTGGSKIRFRDNVIVPIEKHTKCRCLCKTQPEDCTKWQRYNKGSCTCNCSNPDAERKCYADSKKRIWNKETCSCVCKETLDCSTGFYYDPVSCRCEVQEGRVQQNLGPWIA